MNKELLKQDPDRGDLIVWAARRVDIATEATYVGAPEEKAWKTAPRGRWHESGPVLDLPRDAFYKGSTAAGLVVSYPGDEPGLLDVGLLLRDPDDAAVVRRFWWECMVRAATLEDPATSKQGIRLFGQVTR